MKQLREKVASYDCRSNLGFFDMEPLVQEVHNLRGQLQAAQEEIVKYRAIAEPPANYFQKGGAFTLAVDLAVAETVTKCHVSRNQVPLLFIIFARFFRVQLPKHKRKVPYKKIAGKMNYIERELLYIPGKFHVKEVCATLNMAHKLQIGVELLDHGDSKYCYIADGAESLQSEWLAQLLSRRDESTGKLHVTALDLSLLHSKTSEAQAAACRESIKLVAELVKDVGITDEVSPAILNVDLACGSGSQGSATLARRVRCRRRSHLRPPCDHKHI